jgi:hypothetical protein
MLGRRQPPPFHVRWGLSADELLKIVEETPTLHDVVLGCLAERKLREMIASLPQISGVRSYVAMDFVVRGDLLITYGDEEFSLEVKSVHSSAVARDGDHCVGQLAVTGAERRVVTFTDGSQLDTALSLSHQFDLLAVNCFSFENTWCFAFILNRDLPRSTWKGHTRAQREQLIAPSVRIRWPCKAPFTTDLIPLLETLHQERIRARAELR